jgi:hypothetical protein
MDEQLFAVVEFRNERTAEHLVLAKDSILLTSQALDLLPKGTVEGQLALWLLLEKHQVVQTGLPGAPGGLFLWNWTHCRQRSKRTQLP